MAAIVRRVQEARPPVPGDPNKPLSGYLQEIDPRGQLPELPDEFGKVWGRLTSSEPREDDPLGTWQAVSDRLVGEWSPDRAFE
ncbi:MAG: hypothetical protein WC314_19970 [Vulcanimicrobiota bacterium]